MAVMATLAVCVAGSGCSSTSVMSLSTGDCLAVPSGTSGTSVTEVRVLPCDRSHGAEVIGTSVVEGDTMPSTDDLDARAQEDCLAEFEKYVGIAYSGSELGLTWMVPTEESWRDSGDRTITCLALAPDGTSLDATVKGSRH